ncbi:MAG: hypothetical protein NTZ69_09900 [Bacteroidia bacterium]|nr:hypothetical protein [Bacteroidia bacterium]
MNLKIEDIATIFGCTDRTAVRIKEKVNKTLDRGTGSKISTEDLPYLYGVNPSEILLAIYYQTRAFVTISDISRFYGVERRQADNYIKKFRSIYRIKPRHNITVVEFAGLLKIPYEYVFPLMDESIRETCLIKIKSLSREKIGRMKLSGYSLSGADISNRSYCSIAEFSQFWKDYEVKFDNQVWNWPKFWAV